MTGSRRPNGDPSRSANRDDNSDNSAIPSIPSTGGRRLIPQTQDDEDEQIQPALDANEAREIRYLVGSHIEQLTESSRYSLWCANLFDYLVQYKLEQHVIKQINPIPGDEDSKVLCQSATSIVRSAISSSLMEMMQTKYNTDPLGNAFIMVTDAKKAVTQIDIYSRPKLFFNMVHSD